MRKRWDTTWRKEEASCYKLLLENPKFQGAVLWIQRDKELNSGVESGKILFWLIKELSCDGFFMIIIHNFQHMYVMCFIHMRWQVSFFWTGHFKNRLAFTELVHSTHLNWSCYMICWTTRARVWGLVLEAACYYPTWNRPPRREASGCWIVSVLIYFILVP